MTRAPEKNTFVHLEESEIDKCYRNMWCDMRLLSRKYKERFYGCATKRENESLNCLTADLRCNINQLCKVSTNCWRYVYGMLQYSRLVTYVQNYYPHVYPADRAALIASLWTEVTQEVDDVWSTSEYWLKILRSVYDAR